MATSLSFVNSVLSLNENTNTSSRIKIADISIVEAPTNYAFELSGADATRFEIDSSALYLKQATVLDYETRSGYDVLVRLLNAASGNSEAAAQSLRLNILDVNEAPTAVALTNKTAMIDENSNTTNRIKVADVVVTDDALGSNSFNVTGFKASRFEADATGLYIKAGVALNYEEKSNYQVTVNVVDNTLPGSSSVFTNYNLSLNDVNEAPTAVALTNKTAMIDENSNTTNRIKVADVVVTDDALGSNSFYVTGFEAARFEADATGLYIKAGIALNYEEKNNYQVTVNVVDNTLPGSSPVSTNYNLSLNDVNDSPVLTPINPVFNLINNAGVVTQKLVSSLIGNSITDEDANALTSGIAVTSAQGNGNWQYSRDGGTTWLDFGSVSTTSARLLLATDRVRFTPTNASQTPASLYYYGWDRTSGLAGGVIDASSQGNGSAFSIYRDATSTSGDDTLTGTNGNDKIYGLSGNDIIDGKDGNDLLDGGSGSDNITGGFGNDTIYAGSGDDSFSDYYGTNIIYLGSGNDRGSGAGSLIDCGDGDDNISTGRYNGDMTVLGRNGNDTIHITGGEGNYTTIVDGGAGDDLITIDSPPNLQLYGGAGSDTYRFFGGFIKTIFDFQSGDGGDIIDIPFYIERNLTNYQGGNPFAVGSYLQIIQDGADAIIQKRYDPTAPYSGWLTQKIAVLKGVDKSELTTENFAGYNPDGSIPPGMVLIGTNSSDTLIGDSSDDELFGYGGDDNIVSGEGNDIIGGGTGNDSLYAGSGNDRVDGGAGDDLITGGDGAGDDAYIGGEGIDAIKYTSATAAIIVDLDAGTATSLAGGDAAGIGNDTLSLIENVISGNYADIIRGSEGDNKLYGEAGDDRIYSGGGNDQIYGGDGTDVAVLAFSKDAVTKISQIDNGKAVIIKTATSQIFLDSIETIEFNGSTTSAQSLISGQNATPLYTSPTSSTGYLEPEIYSGPVSFLQYQLLGAETGDVVIGAASSDFMNLLGGDDAANGGAGIDVLDGGIGSNFLTGGANNDIFFLDGRGDTVTWSTVTDFSKVAGDQINIWGWKDGISNLIVSQESNGAAGYMGATYHYDLDGNGAIDTSITFSGLTTAQVGNPTPNSVAGNGYLLFS